MVFPTSFGRSLALQATPLDLIIEGRARQLRQLTAQSICTCSYGFTRGNCNDVGGKSDAQVSDAAMAFLLSERARGTRSLAARPLLCLTDVDRARNSSVLDCGARRSPCGDCGSGRERDRRLGSASALHAAQQNRLRGGSRGGYLYAHPARALSSAPTAAPGCGRRGSASGRRRGGGVAGAIIPRSGTCDRTTARWLCRSVGCARRRRERTGLRRVARRRLSGGLHRWSRRGGGCWYGLRGCTYTADNTPTASPSLHAS
jgi:hypothetical protein